MVFMGIAGMRFETEGVHFRPVLPPSLERAEVLDVPYREANVRVELHGSGRRIRRVRVDGREGAPPFLRSDAVGSHVVTIELGGG
jgi:hypothetical protein